MKPVVTKSGILSELSVSDPLEIGNSRILCATDKHLKIQNKGYQSAPAGYGLKFNSANGGGYAYVPHNNLLSLTDNFSIEFWFYYTGTPPVSQYPAIISKGSGTANNYLIGLYQNSAELYFSFYNAGWKDIRSSLYLTANSWNYVGIVVSNNTVLFYLNGVQTNKSFSSSLLTNMYNLYIGFSNNLSGQIPNGTIDELRIYRRALSVYELENNYNAGLGRYVPYDTTNLIGWWHFDEGSGTVAADSSGNNFNATLVVVSDYPQWVNGKQLAGSDIYKNVISADYGGQQQKIYLGDNEVDIHLDTTGRRYYFSEFLSQNSETAFTLKADVTANSIMDVRDESNNSLFKINPSNIAALKSLKLFGGYVHDVVIYNFYGQTGTSRISIDTSKLTVVLLDTSTNVILFLPPLNSVQEGTVVKILQSSISNVSTVLSVDESTSDLFLYYDTTTVTFKNMLCTVIALPSIQRWAAVGSNLFNNV